jgi:hypothetical protein
LQTKSHVVLKLASTRIFYFRKELIEGEKTSGHINKPREINIDIMFSDEMLEDGIRIDYVNDHRRDVSSKNKNDFI